MYSVVLLSAVLGSGADPMPLGSGAGKSTAIPLSDPRLITPSAQPNYALNPYPYGYTNCWGGCSGFLPSNPGNFTPLPALPERPKTDKTEQPKKPEKPETPDKPKKKEGAIETGRAAPARLLVALPADAELFIDGQPTRSAESLRTFTTPNLQPGDTYYYVLRIEMQRDGKRVAEDRRVLLRAGEETRINFNDSAQVVQAPR
jgi:uncharacterized protein (TIGR03000 family)